MALAHAAHLLLTAPRRSVRGGFWLAAWNALKRSLTALCFPACCVPAYGGHLEVHLPLLSMFGFVHQAAGRGRSASESSGVFRNSGSQLGMLCVFGLLHFASRPALYRRTEDVSYYTLRCFRCLALYTWPLDVSDQLRSVPAPSGALHTAGRPPPDVDNSLGPVMHATSVTDHVSVSSHEEHVTRPPAARAQAGVG